MVRKVRDGKSLLGKTSFLFQWQSYKRKKLMNFITVHFFNSTTDFILPILKYCNVKEFQTNFGFF